MEACWAIFTPRNTEHSDIKRVCGGSIYLSPLSKFKQESVDHIIDVIFQVRARYGNEVSFFISGDFNKYPVTNILSANGALKQVVSVATRNLAVLEVILADLATLYHPPTSRPPLEVDKVSRCPALLPPYHPEYPAPTITAASPGADRRTAQGHHTGQYTPTAGGNFVGWNNWSAKLVTVASWCHYGQLVLLWPADGSGWLCTL